MPETKETSVTLQFDYKSGSEMNYAGDYGTILTQIGYNQDVAINLSGGEIFSQSYKTVTGTRVNTVNGLPATLTTYFSQLDGANSSLGDSIKISGTDHTGNIVGAAKVLSPINANLDLTDASEKERTLLVGYGDKMYKIIVPQGAYATNDDLARAVNESLKYAEYVGTISFPQDGYYNDVTGYSSAVQSQIANGAFKWEKDAESARAFQTDLSGEIKISSDGDRLQFVTSKTGDNVRLTISGLDQNLLGFKNSTAAGEGKDTTFEIGYEFYKENVSQLKTTHANIDLTAGGNFTFYINNTMVSLNMPAPVINTSNFQNQTFPAGAADNDYVFTLNGTEIVVPSRNFDGTDATALAAINTAIQEAGFGADARVTAVDTGAGTLTLDTVWPTSKQIEFALDNAIKNAGLGFDFGAVVSMAQPPAQLGTYDISFLMSGNNIDRNTQLLTSFYDTTTNPASSYMESYTPDRFGVNTAKEHTLEDLAKFITELYDNSVSVTMENGKLSVKDLRSGTSKLNVNIKGINEGVGHPTDQSTVMGGKYLGAQNDTWKVQVTTILTNSGQRDVRVVVKDAKGAEIYDQLTENYLGGEIQLPYGVTITPNTMGIPDPADATIKERVTVFDVALTAKGNVGFGDMNVTEDGKNVNIFRSLQNLANALKYDITKNGFSEPSAWKDTSLSSTASPYFDGTFKGMSNDLWKFETEAYNGKNQVFLQNEYTQKTGDILYNQDLIDKLGTFFSFGIDIYDNVSGKSERVDVAIDFSRAVPAVTDTASATDYILKELNGNTSLVEKGVRFISDGGKIEMQSGSGTKIASFASTATGSQRALANAVMGFNTVSNSPLGEFPITLAADAQFMVEDADALADAALSPAYPYRNITVPAGTYGSAQELLQAVNTSLSAAEPNGTAGRITAVIDSYGGIQFQKADGTSAEVSVVAGADNPLNITLERGGAGMGEIFAQGAQKAVTDLSAATDEERTLRFTYLEGQPPQQKNIMITLDKKAYESSFDVAASINEKLAAQGVNSVDLKAVVTSSGVLGFSGSSGNISALTVQGDENAVLCFTKAGDEARIKITAGDGSLVQEVTLDSANKAVHVSDGLYLGFDKGTLKAADSFTGAVGSGIENEIGILDQAEKQVLEALTTVGNRGSRVESVAKFQETLVTSAEKNKAVYLGSTDIDQVRAATELQMAKTAYESALAAASTIMSISLLDFLS